MSSKFTFNIYLLPDSQGARHRFFKSSRRVRGTQTLCLKHPVSHQQHAVARAVCSSHFTDLLKHQVDLSKLRICSTVYTSDFNHLLNNGLKRKLWNKNLQSASASEAWRRNCHQHAGGTKKEEEVWAHIKTCSVQIQMINFYCNVYVLFQRLPKVREHVRGSLEGNTHSRG